jgi:surface protein
MKADLKNAIANKGVSIPDSTVFVDYPQLLQTAVITPLGQLGYDSEAEKRYCKEIGVATLRDDIAYSRLVTPKEGTAFASAFINDESLRFAPMFKGSGSSAEGMFVGCSKLVTVPSYDTSAVTDMSWMFSDCTSLATLPKVDMTKVTTLEGAFSGCSALTDISALDTSNVTSMEGTFAKCSALKTIPALDTSKATTMYGLFNNCAALNTVPALDTANVKTMYYMFNGCTALTTVTSLNVASVKNADSIFGSCKSLKFCLLKNLGKSSLAKWDLSGATAWGTGSDANRQSLIDTLITYSYDRLANSMSAITVTLSAATKALLTAEEIEAMASKGINVE